MGPKKKTTNNSSMRMITMGATLSILSTIICTALGAAVISTGKLPEENMRWCVYLTLLISSIIGVVVSTLHIKEGVMKVRLAVGAAYIIGLFMMTALVFGGKYRGIMPTITIIFTGCLLTIIPRKNKLKIRRPITGKIKRR